MSAATKLVIFMVVLAIGGLGAAIANSSMVNAGVATQQAVLYSIMVFAFIVLTFYKLITVVVRR